MLWRIAAILGCLIFGFAVELAHRGAMTWSDLAILAVALMTAFVSIRQLDIAKQQGDIVLRQLAKMPRLQMDVKLLSITATTIQLGLYVENVGTRRADGFTWQLGVETVAHLRVRALSVEPTMELPAESLTVEGKSYQLFRNRVHSDLYKGRIVLVNKLLIEGSPQPLQMTLLYQVIWDDGEFPGNGYRAQVIEFVATPRP